MREAASAIGGSAASEIGGCPSKNCRLVRRGAPPISRAAEDGHPPISLAATGAALALLVACANIQPPPGGPPDTTPPVLASVFPDSLAVLPDFKGDVVFRFNKVVSEGTSPSQGLGTGDLEKLVILSPARRIPLVRWHRRHISVRPAEGWRPNQAYRIELLPGISDVRQNKSKARTVVTFTTGAPLPTDTLRGRIFDWKAGSLAPAALVEALLEPDSLPYRALADSSGHFAFGPVPHGEYLVYAVLDANKNLRRDPREAFDTVRVRPESAAAAVPDLYAFVHDTLPPRLVEATPTDSVSATLGFATPLDPFQRLDSSAASVRKLPDSTAVTVVALVRQTAATGVRPDTSLLRRLPAPADTGAVKPRPRRADTTGVRPPALPGAAADSAHRPAAMQRPALSDHLVLRVAEPWHAGDRFVIDLTGLRTVSGTSGDTRGVLAIPEPKAAPTRGGPGAADSVRGDSLKVRQKTDSLHRKRR